MPDNKLKPKQKKALLTELVELYVLGGYDITDVVGKPLSYFDFDGVKKTIEELKKEQTEF